MFTDRAEAGRELGERLRGEVAPGALVLGIPRGGVIVAAEVARCVAGELDVVVVRKIGHPGNPEYAAGAIDAAGGLVRGAEHVSDAWFAEEGERERREAQRRDCLYRAGRTAPDVAGRDVVVVDDGIATGLTVRAAVESLKARGAARVVVAAPVASVQAVRMLGGYADEVVVVDAPPGFGSVGEHYRDFRQTTDDEVLAALAGGG